MMLKTLNFGALAANLGTVLGQSKENIQIIEKQTGNLECSS